MKWSGKIIMFIVPLMAWTAPVLGQSTSANPPASGSPASPTQVDPMAASSSQTAATPASSPTDANPVQPTVIGKLKVGWSTAALDSSVPSLIVQPKYVVKKKGKRLSDGAVADLRAKIARNAKDKKSRMRLADHFELIDEPEKVAELLRPVAESLDRAGLLMLARAYRASDDRLQEARVLEKQLVETPNDYVVRTLLGESYAALKRGPQATEEFLEAKRANIKYEPAHDALFRETVKAGQLSDAISIAQDMQENFGSTVKILNRLCLLYADQAFLEKAVETCKAAIVKDPKHAPNHVFLALAIRDQDGDTAALKLIQTLGKQFPNSELAQYVAGEFYYTERKDSQKALGFFKQAVKVNPKSARAQLGVARASFDNKNYDDALVAFVATCKIDKTQISDFRKSTGLLRRENKANLSVRYESGMAECGYR